MRPYQFSPEVRNFLQELSVPIAIFQLVDNQSVLLLCSKAFMELFGYDSPEEVLQVMSTDMYRYFLPDDAKRISDAFFQFAMQGGTFDVMFRNKSKYQDEYHVIHAVGNRLMAGQTQLMVISYSDETTAFSHEPDSENMLGVPLKAFLASEREGYDSLTGLPNMAQFLKNVPVTIRKMKAEGKIPVILYLDCNNLKAFNSRYGFLEGNALLRSLGELLRRYFGAEQSSRFESDHFVVCAERDHIEERLEGMFSEARRLHNGNSPSLKVGIYGDCTETVSLVTACDYARLASNSLQGRIESTYVFFDKEIKEKASLREYVIKHFPQAMAEGWIHVSYQPVVRTMAKTLCGVEALARWIDPTFGFIPPSLFIPALEETGQIYQLDLYMYEQVCKDFQALSKTKIPIVPVSVNLSRKDFQHDDLVGRIAALTRRYGVSTGLANIEITESAFIEDVQSIGKAIEDFHRLGYQVWMDDFGVGYSSLGILKDCSFDVLKIDMSFLSTSSEKARTIIASVVRMAKRIGIQTLAEGVETEEQYQYLRSIGCEKIQGYYFGHSMPGKEIQPHCEKKRIPIEEPAWRDYYDALGKINYQTDSPLCVVEDDGTTMRLLFTNAAYRAVLSRDHVDDVRMWEEKLNTTNSPVHTFHRQFADQQLRKLDGPQIATYPSGDHYMQLTGSVVTHYLNHYIYQVGIQYIQISGNDIQQQNAAYLSNLYYICNDIMLFNLKEDSVSGLKSSLAEQPVGPNAKVKGIQSAADSWCRNFLHPQDHDRYLAFMDIASLRNRLMENEEQVLTGHFRSKTENGRYAWFLHVLIPVPRTDFYQILGVTIKSGLDASVMRSMLPDSSGQGKTE